MICVVISLWFKHMNKENIWEYIEFVCVIVKALLIYIVELYFFSPLTLNLKEVMVSHSSSPAQPSQQLSLLQLWLLLLVRLHVYYVRRKVNGILQHNRLSNKVTNPIVQAFLWAAENYSVWKKFALIMKLKNSSL